MSTQTPAGTIQLGGAAIAGGPQDGARATLAGANMLLPKGPQNFVGFTRDDGGWRPCPDGDIISPFGAFGDPLPGTVRQFRLKVVGFDENAAGDNHMQVAFTWLDGTAGPTFTLPQVSSGAGASAVLYSDAYSFPGPVNTSHAKMNARFVSHAPYNNSAGLYALWLEAWDVPA